MQEIVVYICSAVAIILVLLGFINRRKIDDPGEGYSIASAEIDKKCISSHSDATNRDCFRAELSKAGFRNETIEDILEKTIELKGSVSHLDAISIINALDPLMKIRKDGN